MACRPCSRTTTLSYLPRSLFLRSRTPRMATQSGQPRSTATALILIGWCMTFPINFTGHPAISVPAGLTVEGLPVGLQIIGRRYADESVLALASRFEQSRPWLQSYPGLVSGK
jgi:Asp-tRNA(Asn)/Glu-tRNA(Gln) amidotransferase A subunit family amidase